MYGWFPFINLLNPNVEYFLPEINILLSKQTENISTS